MQKIIFQKVFSNFTSYDLLSVAMASMIIGHFFYYFLPDISWLRVPDRASVVILLVLIGYNAGHRLSFTFWTGALFLTAFHMHVYNDFFINVLGTFIIIRLTITPLMNILLQSRFLFWTINIWFVLLSPFIGLFVEYGTIAYTMAIAGWINRNREEVQNIVSPDVFFGFAFFGYLGFTQVMFDFEFSNIELLSISVLLALAMWCLYNFNILLLNSLKRRPKDIIERANYFLAHKSLEIYMAHVIFFELIFYFFVR